MALKNTLSLLPAWRPPSSVRGALDPRWNPLRHLVIPSFRHIVFLDSA